MSNKISSIRKMNAIEFCKKYDVPSIFIYTLRSPHNEQRREYYKNYTVDDVYTIGIKMGFVGEVKLQKFRDIVDKLEKEENHKVPTLKIEQEKDDKIVELAQLLLECRDALPAITLTRAQLYNVSLTLADRIEQALEPWRIE